MQTKTLEDLLNEANELIPRISYEETIKKINNEDSIIIDVREETEVFNQGIIKDAIHIPRGLLEFKLVLNSSDNPFDINDNTNLLVYCAGGYRSALAGKTLLDLGFKNIFNIGGFQEWVNSGGEIQPI
jgi:rhodanese-related sulfurtransferase